ncbi:heterokaryon incompatibility protein-domain-containing protein [Chiua virens]|nr:heterokaryon incompatibility protein-domain-containing protein [Chiua virens]
MSGLIGRLREQFLSMSVRAKHTPASTPETTLCTTCAALDFKKLLQEGLPEDKMRPLGTLQDITKKSGRCTFCRLVVDLIRRRWRLDNFPNTDVQGVHCSISARGCGTLDPGLSKKDAHRLYIHASPRPFDISASLIAAKAVLYLDIQLLEEDSRKVARPKDLHGRRIPDNVDVRLIKRWMNLCEQVHGETCGTMWWKSGIKDLPAFVRMIDVMQMAVVHAPRNCRFLALSYVWGGPGEYYWTSTANAVSRNRPAGLKVSKLPATIVDAIELARQIGERYLWVDALCILQDSQEDKAMQISIMDRVYGRATLVIIAASGASVRNRLPGMRAGSRIHNQHIECVQGLHLSIPLPSPLEVVNDTVWNTRGWTFQEVILSTRRLYFTKHQVYFECEQGVQCEDVVVETQTTKRSSHPMCHSRAHNFPLVPYSNAEMNVRGYEDVIEQYTPRNLTVDSDVLAAAMALTNVMTTILEPSGSNPQEAFRYGMWIRNLDLSLLWQPRFDAMHTRRIGLNGERSSWPSWAWSGWKGAVNYGIESQMLDGTDSAPHPLPAESFVTAWNLVDHDGSVVRLHVDRIPPSWNVDSSVNPDGTSPFKYSAPESRASDLVLDFLAPRGTLIFRTQCARFQVLKMGDMLDRATAHTVFHILPINQVTPHYAGRIILPINTPSKTILELIVLSRCDGLRGLCDSTMWGEHYYGCMLHVMAVQETHDDIRVSERVGVGLVVEAAWMKCEAEERVVLLA